MRVFVVGCGRSGTNLLFETIRASEAFEPSKNIEDRDIFGFRELPKKYLTKIAVERVEDENILLDYHKKYKDLRFVFSFRHPYDVLMSKMYRGQPKNKGGDNTTNQYMEDSDPDVACQMIEKNWRLYKNIPYEVTLPVKMENLLSYTEGTVRLIAGFIRTNVTDDMVSPWKFNTNRFQVSRYGRKKADTIDLWKSRTSFNGHFKNFDFSQYNNYLIEEAKYFDYELI